MITEELQQKLEDHKKYRETDGKEGAIANLRYADLSGADLSSANLRYADLSSADLSGAIGFATVTARAIEILLEIADLVCTTEASLDMQHVHKCQTTHCGTGWVCTIDPSGSILEKLLGWNVAACLLCPIPEFTGLFFGTNEKMTEFLESVRADRAESLKLKYLSPNCHNL